MAVTKALNSISDVIPGVTLNLTHTNTGAPISLAVSEDTSSIQTAVQGLVSGFNAFASSMKNLTGYDAATSTGGPLQGDTTARTIDTSVRRLLSASIVGAGSYTTLSQIGVSFQKEGTLSLDSTKLQAAISANEIEKGRQALAQFTERAFAGSKDNESMSTKPASHPELPEIQ